MIDFPVRVLVVTNDWPTHDHPEWATFIVDQVHALRKEGMNVDVFPFRGGKNLFRYLFAWVKLRRHLSLRSYDLIHAHFGQSGLLCLPKMLPLIVTFHGSDLQGYLTRQGTYSLGSYLLRSLSRLVVRQADHCIVVADHLRNFLPLNIPVTTIPCGIDFDLFRPMSKTLACQKLGLNQEKQYILFPSNPQRRVKRFSLAQETMHILQKCVPTSELLTLSNVSHDLVPYYINACDAILLTSFHEGSPTVVKEALACNTAIVSVDVGDVRMLVENIAGCFVCQDDAESIAHALVQVLSQPQKICGRDKIQHFSQDKIVKQILAVYGHVCSG